MGRFLVVTPFKMTRGKRDVIQTITQTPPQYSQLFLLQFYSGKGLSPVVCVLINNLIRNNYLWGHRQWRILLLVILHSVQNDKEKKNTLKNQYPSLPQHSPSHPPHGRGLKNLIQIITQKLPRYSQLFSLQFYSGKDRSVFYPCRRMAGCIWK